MVGIGAVPISVWAYVIAKTKKSIVELHPVVMATIIGCTEDEIRRAVDVLCAPDEHSTNPDHEGRRLLKQGPYEYFVVSWERYNSIRNEEERRAYNRAKQQEHRAKTSTKSRLSKTVNDRSKPSAMSAHSDSDASSDSDSEDPAIVEPQRPDSCAVVFAHWQETMDKHLSKLDSKRKSRIRARLKDFTAEQLCKAITNAKLDDWIMGRDPKSPHPYDGIETILRDNAQVERLIALETTSRRSNDPAETMRRLEEQQAKEWISGRSLKADGLFGGNL